MRQTNADLRHYYRVANKKYFGDKLPKGLPMRFAKLKPGGLGVTHILGNRVAYGIEISVELRTNQSFTIMTVLHEMLHVEKPSYKGHGHRFDKRMLRLAKAGAFDGLW
jgi:hypothetical protein